MPRSQFNHYLLRETGAEYNYLGLGVMLHDEGPSTNVCILSPVISGFAPNPPEGFTRFFICDENEFDTFFEEASPLGEPVERK